MMNRKTRKLSKMPEEVRAEISPYFLSRSAIKDESTMTQKISRLNGNADYVRSGLTVSRPFFSFSFP
jgi:fatty acyl-ACP thioesterase B